MTEIAKIVRMLAKPGRVGDLEAALRELLAPSRNEAASVACELHRSADRGGQFMVYERWRDEAGFAAHMAEPHVTAFLAVAEDLLAEPAEVQSFIPLP